ncbi:hypothetical protein N864_23510 [Intrasporangium chromatireducens Q5-1]|uniref:Uncharacterized protein n=1 Tax=Intrasporangium chromatireducens Q5-1 TaxID=584657 RepID=W9GRQ8_9MICO|nr:hypothetical protein [Intrasporangium chromatireducens]EWT07737.1 hypothetical protein N864_23510 [Intrasporangium chromatireducens Q5-1]
MTEPIDAPALPLVSQPTSRATPRGFWAAARAAVGVVLGIVPHVMHHIGLLAGAALLTGVWGNGVLYIVGLLLSIPLLRRIHARFRTPWAPVLGVAAFTTLFALSAFIIGPALSGATAGATPDRTPTPTVTSNEHAGHH